MFSKQSMIGNAPGLESIYLYNYIEYYNIRMYMMQYTLQKCLVLPGYDLIKLVVCSLGKMWETVVAVWYAR